MRLWLIAGCGLMLLSPCHVEAWGVLDEIRKEVSTPSPGDNRQGGSPAPARTCDDDTDSLVGALLAPAFTLAGYGLFMGASSPFWGPHLLMKDNLSHNAAFLPFHYANDQPGYLLVGNRTFSEADEQGKAKLPGAGTPTESVRPEGNDKNWSVRALLDEGNDLRKMNRLGGRFVVDTGCRFGLQTSWNYYQEQLGQGHTDQTVLGDGHVTYRFAQCDWGQMYAGLGFKLLTDSHLTRGGFNILYAGDFFPADPLIVSALVDLGNLGEQFTIHGRATVGVSIQSLEVFTGYDFQRIGSVNLQGPLVGFRLWF